MFKSIFTKTLLLFRKKLPVATQDEVDTLTSSLHSIKDKLLSHISTLTQEKQKLSALLSSIYDGVVAIDDQKRILLYNEPFLKILGMGNQNLQGKKIFDFICPPSLILDLEACLEHKKIYQKQIKIVQDTEKYFECIISPLFSSSQEAKGAVAIFHDISELKKLEHLRMDFVANASHELKTPLAVIRGYADTLLEGGPEDKDHHLSFIKAIQDHSKRLTSIVEDLLTLSRLETSHAIEKIAIHLTRFVENVTQHLSPLAKEKNISIQTQFITSHISADPHTLEQALLNLLDNAIKYNPAGTQIVISSKKENDHIKLSIQDTGIGISPEHLPRIFERFYRVDQSRSRELGGTGLGLAIVKHVALLHGGQVEVESTPGQGSTFSLLFPTA